MLVRLFSVLLLSILFIAGCTSRRGEEQGEVSGKVTYNGKPLPGGRISFYGAKGYNGEGIISPQGEYSLHAPLGEVQIRVDNTILRPNSEEEQEKAKRFGKGKANLVKLKPWQQKEGGDKKTEEMTTSHGVTGRYVPIPKRYINPNTSGLKYTVKPGSQTFDIELTDSPSPVPGK
jgi:hypothetical protein